MSSEKQIDFARIQANFDRMERTLPRLLGNKILNHAKQSFRDQGWTDEGLDPWAQRKRGNKADRRTGKTRAILIDSGALRRSLSVQSASMKAIRVGSYGIPYAGRHNRGLSGMPKRQFVGKSKKLSNKLELLVRREFKRAFDK